MPFVENLNYIKSKLKFTNYQLAKELGCSQSSVKNWIEGSNLPHTNTRLKIAEHFGITLAELDGDALPVLPDEAPPAAPSAQKNTAAPKDDGITDYIDLASRRIRCAHPLSILAAQYSVPAFLMQQLIGCDFNRAEGLILGRYQPTTDELLRAAEGFSIPYDDLEQGWIPLSANPEVLARFTGGKV